MHPVVEHAWDLVPKRMQDAIASGVDRLHGVTPPPVPVPDATKPYRLLVGPVNYAGQGFRWSRTVEGTGLVSARNYVHSGNNILGYEADHLVSWRIAEHSRAWQGALLEEIRHSYTHVLIEACFPILGGMFRGDVRRQVALIRDAGVNVAVVGHGNEVRLPSRHAREVPFSHFGADVEGWAPLDRLETAVADNLQLIADLDVPTFVSTPGLLQDLPDAHLLGVVVDAERWTNDRSTLTRDRLRVVHAPTQPHVKGTTLIRPAVDRLVAEGLIEYVELTGVPNAEMPAVFADADVILDQFRIGDYGVGACEAMAAGRIVLTYLTDAVREEASRQAGMPIPIPEVTVDTLESVLRDIAAHRDRYREIAVQGPEFVRRLHNGEFSRKVLMREFLEA